MKKKNSSLNQFSWLNNFQESSIPSQERPGLEKDDAWSQVCKYRYQIEANFKVKTAVQKDFKESEERSIHFQ